MQGGKLEKGGGKPLDALNQKKSKRTKDCCARNSGEVEGGDRLSSLIFPSDSSERAAGLALTHWELICNILQLNPHHPIRGRPQSSHSPVHCWTRWRLCLFILAKGEIAIKGIKANLTHSLGAHQLAK